MKTESVGITGISAFPFGRFILWSRNQSECLRSFPELPEYQHFALVDSFYGLRFNRNYYDGISQDELDEISRVLIKY